MINALASVPRLRWAILAGLGIIVVGCVDPPTEPLVTVTIRGLASTPANAYVGNPDQVVVTLFFPHADTDAGWSPGSDASVPPLDAAFDPAREQRRIIAWDYSDPFVFPIQLPDRDLTGVWLEATTVVQCSDGPRKHLVAYGSDGRVIHPSFSHSNSVDLTVRAAPLEPVCR